MNSNLLEIIIKLISKTNNNEIKWQRINKTTFEYKKNIVLDENSGFLERYWDTITTINEKSGNFINGQNTFYTLTVVDKNSKEVLVEIEVNKKEQTDGFSTVDKLFKTITKFYNNRGKSIFEKLVE